MKCERCGDSIPRPADRCTNRRCLKCHAARCAKGGATYPGHGATTQPETRPMDPDALLDSFIRTCRTWHAAKAVGDDTAQRYAAADATDALGDLRLWIANGGFLPRDPREGTASDGWPVDMDE